jgi:hypothetical protein
MSETEMISKHVAPLLHSGMQAVEARIGGRVSGQAIWAEWDDGDLIQQGDLVRRRPDATASPVWGLIITADCDIAQNKAGNRYTWIRIVSGADYLCSTWAPDQLRRLVEKQARVAAEGLGARLRRSDPELTPLTGEGLCRWLEQDDPTTIWAAVAPEGKADAKLLRIMQALHAATDPLSTCSPMDRLRRAWTLLGRSAAEQAGMIGEALKGDRGFPDFFLLPELPQTDGFGFVILLRDIASVDADAVFGAELEARLADRPDGFHRFGRLQDGVRFAVTQKLAFLFSRIGMPTSFEDACAAAADLLVHQMNFQEGSA